MREEIREAPSLRRRGGLAIFLMAVTLGVAGESDYRAEILLWRKSREEKLRAETGWLAVRGLFWLKEGTNRFGTDPNLEIVLPAGATAPRAGVFEHGAGKTTVALEPGVPETDGRFARARELKPDSDEPEDTVRLGRLTLQVIERGGRYGVRLRDPDTPTRRNFTGLRWFPVDESERVVARFVPFDPPREVAITNVIGQVSDLPSPGRAVFTLAGRELSLEPVLESPDAQELFFIFRDETSGRETYGAGRFLYAALPKDGTVVLDFNKAYSPPCAYTAHATCPLPPRQNVLPVPVLAGEKDPGVH